MTIEIGSPQPREAKLFAASLSTKHGDRISGEDLNAVAREITFANPDYSIKDIAKYSNVTRQTASRWVSDIVEHRRALRKCGRSFCRERDGRRR